MWRKANGGNQIASRERINKPDATGRGGGGEISKKIWKGEAQKGGIPKGRSKTAESFNAKPVWATVGRIRNWGAVGKKPE